MMWTLFNTGALPLELAFLATLLARPSSASSTAGS